MSKKNIITTILFLSVIGLAAIGYLKAVPGVSEKMENRPKIEISPSFFDFGTIEFGRVAEYTFKIKNSGKEILEIKRVATSCACTTAKISKEKIEPGEEADLLVSYDTVAMGDGPHGKGKQERIIYVKSNDPINPQIEAMIYANVF